MAVLLPHPLPHAPPLLPALLLALLPLGSSVPETLWRHQTPPSSRQDPLLRQLQPVEQRLVGLQGAVTNHSLPSTRSPRGRGGG